MKSKRDLKEKRKKIQDENVAKKHAKKKTVEVGDDDYVTDPGE